jgi:hypothetical protein
MEYHKAPHKGEINMKRKVVSCVLVASLLFSIGCYSTEVVTKEEFKAKDEQVDITVYTKDSLEYKFSKGQYRIQGDTLSAWSRVLTIVPSSTLLSFQERVALLESGGRISPTRDSIVASIALADITSIKTEEFDGLKTIALIALFGSVGFLLIAVIGVLITPGK